MMRPAIVSLVALAALAGAACFRKSVTEPVYCTAEARPAITLIVVDSVTNQPALFQNLWAVARDGTYKDSVAVSLGDVQKGNVTVSLAYERAGVYTVSAKADGYQLWSKSGVTVTGDVCHVTTVSLTARLAH
jgi:hypothetical protein